MDVRYEEVRRKFQALAIKRDWKRKNWNNKKEKNTETAEVWVIEDNMDISFTSPAKKLPTALLQEFDEKENFISRNLFHDEAEVSGEDSEEEEIEEFEGEDSFIDDDEESERSCISENSFSDSYEEYEQERLKTPQQNSIIDISSDEEEFQEKENTMKSNRPSELQSIPNSRLSTQVFYDSPIKTRIAEKMTKTKSNIPFQKNKEMYLRQYYIEFNQRIFDNQLPKNPPLIWSVHLTKTAGRCISTLSSGNNRSIKIEMSSKVVDSIERLKITLSHEMCHAATFMINQENNPNHGKSFKQWGYKVHQVYPEITVTTTHSYDINYKYKYQCVGCKAIYGRFSKSVDTKTSTCGRCNGNLILLDEKLRASNKYNQYVKENFSAKKEKFPGLSTIEIMKKLSNDYKSLKN
eukprot:gene7896-12364_t